MMSVIFVEILVILLLILLNGFLSMSEIAVVSSRKVRLQQRAKADVAGARSALELATKPNQFLSAVQIGITLIGVLAGAFGGATIAEELEGYLSALPIQWLAAYSEAISVSLVVLVVTFLTLILGELAPKQIGLNNPEGIAARIAPPMQVFSRLTAPVVHFLIFSSNLVLRLLRIRPSAEPEITEEEIKLLIKKATEGGIFEPKEEDILEQVLRLADRLVTTEMTPRTEIIWLDLEDPLEEVKSILVDACHSYYPVGRGDLDRILGVVQAKDLLAQTIQGNPFNLEEKLLQPLFIPESMNILDTLERFRECHTQIAIIIDEFGGVQGLTTISDILEAISGDFPGAFYVSEPEVIAREDGTYLLDGMLDIDEFKSLFELDALPGEEENHYQTLGGFVMTFLQRIPTTGEEFEYENLHFEVVDMDNFRIDKVLVNPNRGLKEKATGGASFPGG